jgi:hypothetical protein
MEITDALILSIFIIGLWVLAILLLVYHNRLDRIDAARKEIEKGQDLPPYHIHPPMYQESDDAIIIPITALTR